MNKYLLVFMILIGDVLYSQNISTMSVDQLIILRSQVNEELAKKGSVKEAILPAGDYEVGKNFPEGIFVITSIYANKEQEYEGFIVRDLEFSPIMQDRFDNVGDQYIITVYKGFKVKLDKMVKIVRYVQPDF